MCKNTREINFFLTLKNLFKKNSSKINKNPFDFEGEYLILLKGAKVAPIKFEFYTIKTSRKSKKSLIYHITQFW